MLNVTFLVFEASHFLIQSSASLYALKCVSSNTLKKNLNSSKSGHVDSEVERLVYLSELSCST